jgi:lantibiotic modifying enzyme
VVSQLTAGGHSASLLAHLDSAIQEGLTRPELDGYDLYEGLAGVLLAYADDDIRGDRVLARVLDCLEQVDLIHPKRHEFGCAHGVAGVLGALACCHVHGRTDERAEPLMLAIAGALENSDVSDQRIGWCRGEIGIAIALLSAARALDRDDLADRAIAVALEPFARRGGRWPIDAGLCHGAAGLAHLYNRMYQATGDGRLGEHAHTWLCKTMAMQTPGNGIAGFTMFRPRRDPEWEADPSLLVGASGVGLVMLAGATSVTPSWDRVLGVNVGRPA